MVIVDTSVRVDYLRGIPSPEAVWLDRELTGSAMGVTDLILCEILQCIRTDQRFSKIQRELNTLYVFQAGGEELATASVQNYRPLRAQGYTVRSTIDCLTATFCLERGHSLLHRDRDFGPFEQYFGLQVIHPPA
ncbi:MAG TPA: PIN domain nuclease [Acidisarcina sp.]